MAAHVFNLSDFFLTPDREPVQQFPPPPRRRAALLRVALHDYGKTFFDGIHIYYSFSPCPASISNNSMTNRCILIIVAFAVSAAARASRITLSSVYSLENADTT